MQIFMGTTPVESLVAAGNIFVGQVSWNIEKHASTEYCEILLLSEHLCIKKSSFHMKLGLQYSRTGG